MFQWLELDWSPPKTVASPLQERNTQRPSMITSLSCANHRCHSSIKAVLATNLRPSPRSHPTAVSQQPMVCGTSRCPCPFAQSHGSAAFPSQHCFGVLDVISSHRLRRTQEVPANCRCQCVHADEQTWLPHSSLTTCHSAMPVDGRFWCKLCVSRASG